MSLYFYLSRMCYWSGYMPKPPYLFGLYARYEKRATAKFAIKTMHYGVLFAFSKRTRGGFLREMQ